MCSSDLDDRLDTHLTRDGRPLSDSQLRRLMLARAFVARPRLLLIDGLLDALSDDAANALLQTLKEMKPCCSIVIATNQPTIIEQCDRVWKLAEATQSQTD